MLRNVSCHHPHHHILFLRVGLSAPFSILLPVFFPKHDSIVLLPFVNPFFPSLLIREGSHYLKEKFKLFSSSLFFYPISLIVTPYTPSPGLNMLLHLILLIPLPGMPSLILMTSQRNPPYHPWQLKGEVSPSRMHLFPCVPSAPFT